MDLKIPNIVKPIALKDYADEFGEAVIWVWVNPTRALRTVLLDKIVLGESTEDELYAWFAEIWSQGTEDTRFTPDDVLVMSNNCMGQDPQLWIWLVSKTFGLIAEHYNTKKKTSITPPSS
jgi:hypothetical protein